MDERADTGGARSSDGRGERGDRGGEERSCRSSAHAKSVGNQSTACMRPSWSTPLHCDRDGDDGDDGDCKPQTSAGTLTPPSHEFDLPPLKGKFNPPEETLPPLSLEKMTSVRPSSRGEVRLPSLSLSLSLSLSSSSSWNIPRRPSAPRTVAIPSSMPATRPQKDLRHGRRT